MPEPATLSHRGVLSFVALLVVSAGCSGNPSGADAFGAEASHPLILPGIGHVYNGSDVVAGDGSLRIRTRESPASGMVEASIALPDGRRFEFRWTRFDAEPDQGWMRKGITSHMEIHGNTGRGDPREPRIFALSAGWGTVTGIHNGTPLVDPLSGSTQFGAHYMVTRDAMLDEHSHAVFRKDGRTPYDPRSSSDGLTFAGRAEAHFAVYGFGTFDEQVAEHLVDTTTQTNPVDTPTYKRAFPVLVRHPSSTVDVRLSLAFSVAPPALQTAFLHAKLQDAEGHVYASGDLSPANPNLHLETPAGILPLGKSELLVTGSGRAAKLESTITVTAPDPFLLYAVYTQVGPV